MLDENKQRVLAVETRIKEAKLENLQLASDAKAVTSKRTPLSLRSAPADLGGVR